MSITLGRTSLDTKLHLPSAAKKNCFHCGEKLGELDHIFVWVGDDDALVMHMPCLSDWCTRAQKDVVRYLEEITR